MRLIFALISLSVLASGGSVHKWHGLFDHKDVEPQGKSKLIFLPFFTARINNQNGRLTEKQNLTSLTTTTGPTTPKPTSLEPTLNKSKPLAADEFHYLKYFFDRRLFNQKPNRKPTHGGSLNRRLAHIRIFRRPTHDGMIHSRSTHVDKIVKRPIPKELKDKIRTPIDAIDSPTPKEVKDKMRTPIEVLDSPTPKELKDKIRTPIDALDSPTPKELKDKIRTLIDAVDSPTPKEVKDKMRTPIEVLDRPTPKELKDKIRTPIPIDAIESPTRRETRPNNRTILFRPTSNDIHKIADQDDTVQSRNLKDIYMTPTYNGTSYKREENNDTASFRPKRIDPIDDTQVQNATDKKTRDSNASKISTPYSIKCKRHQRYIGLRPMLNVIKFLSFL